MEDHGFDKIAPWYDQMFTDSALGTMQRKIVFNYLDKILAAGTIRSVLELNCGTGEDAIYLRKKGCHVLATDLSSAMLKVAESKTKEQDVEGITFLQLDINQMGQLQKGMKFDLIFSDFGGFNCLGEIEIQSAAMIMKDYLSQSGLIVLVLMPDKCILEQIYGLLKFDKDLMIRRSISPQRVKISGAEIMTWYYAPKMIRQLFRKNDYKQMNVFPIGFIPSYFSPAIERKSWILRILSWMNSLAIKANFLSAYSDHYLISFARSSRNN